MKRFTGTEKWDKLWHRKLPCRLKCFWDYLCSKCNAIGLWEADFELASLQIGEPITAEDIKAFEGRLEWFDDKILIVDFIEFQYGSRLSQHCPAHKPILALLKANPKVHNRVLNTLPDSHPPTLTARVQEKETDKEKEKDRDKGPPPGSLTAATDCERLTVADFEKLGRSEQVRGLLMELGTAAYGRPANQWPTDPEQRAALEVVKRPAWEEEKTRILIFVKALAPEDRRFELPKSLCRLLEEWSQTLDKARNYTPNNGNNHHSKTNSRVNTRNAGTYQTTTNYSAAVEKRMARQMAEAGHVTAPKVGDP